MAQQSWSALETTADRSLTPLTPQEPALDEVEKVQNNGSTNAHPDAVVWVETLLRREMHISPFYQRNNEHCNENG
jgi:hypothetical protein